MAGLRDRGRDARIIPKAFLGNSHRLSGLYSVVQVVDAYRLYYAAKRDYLQARYDYLLNRLKLKQSVSSLSRNDLEDLAELLK